MHLHFSSLQNFLLLICPSPHTFQSTPSLSLLQNLTNTFTLGSSTLKHRTKQSYSSFIENKDKDEIRDSDIGAGKFSRYYGESWRVIATRSIQRDWWWTQRWPNCVRFSHSLPIPGSSILLPSCCLPCHTTQSCTCHCSWCFSLGCCYVLRCCLLHLLTGSGFSLFHFSCLRLLWLWT